MTRRYLQVIVPLHMHRAVRRHARRQNRPSTEILRDALAVHLAALDATVEAGARAHILLRHADGREVLIGTTTL